MDRIAMLKAIADETRMRLLILLLKHNLCVRALARTLGLTEATISQHLKVMREAGLLVGEKRGYYVHYDVRREELRELAIEIDALAAIERETSRQESDTRQAAARHAVCPKKGECHSSEQGTSNVRDEHADEFCHYVPTSTHAQYPTDSESKRNDEFCNSTTLACTQYSTDSGSKHPHEFCHDATPDNEEELLPPKRPKNNRFGHGKTSER